MDEAEDASGAMKRKVAAKDAGRRFLDQALTKTTWIKSSAGGARRWCADCVLRDPPPRELLQDPSLSARPEPTRL